MASRLQPGSCNLGTCWAEEPIAKNLFRISRRRNEMVGIGRDTSATGPFRPAYMFADRIDVVSPAVG